MTEAPRISAEEIAARLGLRPPTDQQIEVIQAPLGPARVVAGAGSGKTETMASRVLWLVANGLARPSDIIGLTFTRKAAGELGQRMRERIAQLRAQGLVPDLARDGEESDPAAELLDAPTISTYNAFAGALFRENAALAGHDGDAVILSEASAWLLARDLVRTSDDPRLVATAKRVDDVTGAVLRVSAALAENDADGAAAAAYAEEFVAHVDTLAGSADYGLGDIVARVGGLPVLVDLAVQFDALKRARGYQQFSDQLVTALRLLDAHPSIGETMRRRYPVVILDEYQDTSIVQARVLARLFAGRAVMAVGDPNQAIYGWRGASASNLAQFPVLFGGTAGPEAVARFDLSISWRNGVEILRAANRIIEPLPVAAGLEVKRLEARKGADAIRVASVFEETVAEEAQQVARWLRAQLDDRAQWTVPDGEDEPGPPTAALLLRARATLEHFLKALQAEKVPYHVLGVGGLLAEPAIADLVAALAVIDDASAGSELVRLLVGSRWRIGLADVRTLHDVASWLEKRDLAQQELTPEVAAALRGSVVDEESSSLVEALDFVAHAPEGHIRLRDFSSEGLVRLREAGRLFRGLRRRARLDLADLATTVIEALDLDIEVEANTARTSGERAFEAFFDALQGFQSLGAGASLRAFLGWLREAETRDRLTPRSDPPERGCVQIVTIHGAKGLEWDVVAVPRLVEQELPRANREAQGWAAFGQLPYAFRGDADALPEFDWRSTTTRKELSENLDAFKREVYAGQLEEDRRLAYVAITRARHRLLLSGSFWSSQKYPRSPSPYLRELAETGVIDDPPEAPETVDANPTTREPDAITWPRDPLGTRRDAVVAAAALVREAPVGRAGVWEHEIRLLLAERAAALAGPGDPPPPVRVPASRFAEYVSAPEEVVARLLRPMPEKPYRATRLGTLFHAWVEHRALPGGGSGEPLLDAADRDALVTEVDAEPEGDLLGVDADRLAALQATFEASPWASRRPVEVEREIHLPFDDRIVICKIDAVYRDEVDPERFEIVDWKTGKAPKDDADLERKQLQLALYRLAYARWSGVPLDRIDAAFYFVADDRIIRPEHLDSEEELLARWRAAFGS